MIKRLIKVLERECISCNLRRPVLMEIPSYNDIPKIPHFTVRMDNEIFGLDLQPHALDSNSKMAKMKAVVEAIERFYYKFPNLNFVTKSSNSQFNKIGNYNINKASKNKKKYIQVFDIYGRKRPIQDILFITNKQGYQYQTTIGTAAHFLLKEALILAVLELIAADAFKNFYFENGDFYLINKKSINLRKVKKIISLFNIYQFSVNLLILNSKIPNVFVVLSVLEDKTNYYKGIALGIKASLNIEEAIIGSLYESIAVYKGLRTIIENKEFVPESKKPNHLIKWLTSSFLAKKILKKINKKKQPTDLSSFSTNNKINLLNLLKSKKIPIYWNIISPKRIKEIHVVRAISPYFSKLKLRIGGHYQNSNRRFNINYFNIHPLS